MAATVEELQSVPDIGLVVATSLHETLRRADTAATIAALHAAGVNVAVLDEDRPVAAADGAPLDGVTVVVTGAITDPATGAKVVRGDFERGVAGLGATIASSVSAKTGLLMPARTSAPARRSRGYASRRRRGRPGGHLGAADRRPAIRSACGPARRDDWPAGGRGNRDAPPSLF